MRRIFLTSKMSFQYVLALTIDEESGIIRLVHYTTQEYFDRNWTSWFPNAEKDIAKTCVTYQLFSTFRSGSCARNELKKRLRLNPLYDYAARNWAYYASSESTEVEELILDFLQNDAAVSASGQAAVIAREYLGYDNWVPKEMRGTHLAAYFGLEKVMKNLLRKGHHPDSKDSFNYTPLSWAALKGHDEVVKLLLATAGVNADSHTNVYRTPLSLAAASGHELVVKLLLAEAGVNVNSMDQYSMTPLYIAAGRGNEEVVKLLLATPGIDVNSRNMVGTTPLSEAACNGLEEVVKLLVATTDIDVNSNSDDGETPLFLAAQNGHVEVVKLLLATPGVNVDSENIDGKTPLSIAASTGHEEVVKLLESSGAKTDETRGEPSP
jgi:ankyrin repeat protein